MGKKDDMKKKKLESAGKALGSAAEKVSDQAEDALDAVKNQAEDIVDAVKDKAEDIVDAVKDKAEDIADAAEDKAEDIADAVEDKAEDIADAAEDKAEDIADAVKGKAEDADEPKKKKHHRTPEAERERALNKVKRRKKFKYGILATVITLVFLAIVLVVNLIVGALDKRYNWSIDLTSKGLYQIDDQTADYLHKLSSDIDMIMLADESLFETRTGTLKLLAETLKRFETESNGKIKVQYINPTTHPEVQNLYLNNTNETATEGSVVVKCGDLVRLVPFTDLINQESQMDYTTYEQVTKTTFTGEQALISAIIGVTDLHPVKVGLIDKTNGAAIYPPQEQYCYTRLNELLSKNNYEAESIDIATQELSEDYDVLILCSPSSDLTETQVQKLSDYLHNDGKCGKTLIYFASIFRTTDIPNLNAFLELWGLSVQNAVVVESDSAKGQIVNTSLQQLPLSNIPVVTPNMEEELNQNYRSGNVPIVAPYHCAINTLFEDNSGRVTSPLLVASDTAVVMPLDSPADDFDINTAEKGAWNVAVLAENNFFANSENYQSRLIAFGSALFVDYFIGGSAASYDNSNYFMTLLNSVSGKDNAITVASKSLDPTKITVTAAQSAAIRNVILLVIPAAVVLIGILVYVRRRNK